MLLDVSARRIVIVGAGRVAARKAFGVIDAGASAAHVRVVAPMRRADFPAGVESIAAEYGPHHLDGAELVFAATDSAEVNARVVTDAHERGLLVCRADINDELDLDGTHSDFITPAKLARGPVLLTVSAGGSPALSAAIRDELASRFDNRWVLLAAATQLLRVMIRQNPLLSVEDRRLVFRELAQAHDVDAGADATDERAVQAAAERLMSWLKKKHPELPL